MLSLSLPREEFAAYVARQMNHFFPDGHEAEPGDALYRKALDMALDRTFHCFRPVSLPAYNRDGATHLSHLHSDQYSAFLWFLSNSFLRVYGDNLFAQKAFYLNKALNGVVCMYDAQMPDIFLVLHGAGAMLGKAAYQDFFIFCQGVTVGASHGLYPTLGRGVALLPGATVVGPCNVGDGVTFGANTLTNSIDIPPCSVRFIDRDSGEYGLQPKETPWAQQYFNVPVLP